MENLEPAIQHKIDFKTKPLGSLGILESLVKQICLVQNTLEPKILNPTHLVFAADHGITESGVSSYPSSVTAEMVKNFLKGGAAINVFCRQHQIDLKIIDAGVNFDFEENDKLINAKIRKGTHNFLHTPAMNKEELEKCFELADKQVDLAFENGSNCIGFGEMGIGNTSAASLLMSVLMNFPLEICVGKGTGLSHEGLANKVRILQQAKDHHQDPKDAMEALQTFGGFEIAQICGAMLRSFQHNMLILVDGFIATAAFLCAKSINPEIQQNAIFCHQSDEQGHQRMLEFLGAKPLLHLEMRLGEGTGCAVAFPLIESAIKFFNEMSDFESAGVSNKN
jgi:nicotinate-nucleotide--dimethylbenzimidazole phosphoribosyltransferase